VSRAAGSAAFPARFQLVGAANPCRRGCASIEACACTPGEKRQYLARLSRPLLDRIDLHLEVPAVAYGELAAGGGESSTAVRGRVEVARRRQAERLAGSGARVNARMSGRQVRRFCSVSQDATRLLGRAVSSLGLSARGHDRVLKVARTIADLSGCERIALEHVSEAVQYRGLDRGIGGCWSGLSAQGHGRPPGSKEIRMATPHPMTLPREGTPLLIVDVQERLFPAMDADHREEVMRNIKVLAATARRLRLPVVAT